jgi:hypothetical protein
MIMLEVERFHPERDTEPNYQSFEVTLASQSVCSWAEFGSCARTRAIDIPLFTMLTLSVG